MYGQNLSRDGSRIDTTFYYLCVTSDHRDLEVVFSDLNRINLTNSINDFLCNLDGHAIITNVNEYQVVEYRPDSLKTNIDTLWKTYENNSIILHKTAFTVLKKFDDDVSALLEFNKIRGVFIKKNKVVNRSEMLPIPSGCYEKDFRYDLFEFKAINPLSNQEIKILKDNLRLD